MRSTRSTLVPEIGRSARVTAVVTGPVRRSTFALRLPAEVRRFDERTLHEKVLLELPLGRSPPQGAVLELRATVAAPRGPEDGFDERGWLARRGVHVVLHGRGWRIVGRRGGIGGISDRLRAHVARAITPGLDGERHAVLAGIVLGEDEGLTDELRDDFKAAGLYHLLAVSGQNITFLALGVLGLAWLLGIPRLAAEVVAIAAIVGLCACGRLAAVGRARGRRRRPRLARLAALAAARPVALPRSRRRRAARVDTGEPARARIPTLVRGRRVDLPAAAAVSAGTRGLPADGLAPRRNRSLDRLRRRDRADPLAPVRQRPRLLAACERPRHARDRPAARDRARRVTDRARAADSSACARVAERVAGRLHRRLRTRRRRAAVRAGRIRHRRLSAARDAGRAARPPASAAVAAPAGGRERRSRAPGAARLAAAPGRALAAADRAPDHVPRCRSGRLDPAPGAAGRRARRPGAAGGGRRATRCGHSASDGWRRSCSRIPSATTSAVRRPS